MSAIALSELCDLITDGTHYTPPDLGSGVPFLTVKDMSASGLDFETCARISNEEFLKAKAQNSAPRQGDILFSKDGTVGKVHVVVEPIDFAVLSSIAILRPNPSKLDASFAAHYLRSPEALAAAAQRKTGSALTRIILKDLKQLRLPLLPLDEQKRIAAILDQANELRRKRQRAMDRLNQLGQAIFHDMFGDPLCAPSAEREWTTESLDSNIEFMDYRGKTPLKAESGIRLITARNVKMGFINIEPKEFVEADSYASWMTRGFPEKGDVLFTTEAPLGHVAQLDTDETVVIGQRLITMKPNRDLIRPTYLEFFLRTPSFRRKMFENSTGSTVIGIKSKLLKKIDIRYPAKSLQDKFEASILQLRATVPHFAHSAIEIEKLFASLQQRAFKGELATSGLEGAAA